MKPLTIGRNVSKYGLKHLPKDSSTLNSEESLTYTSPPREFSLGKGEEHCPPTPENEVFVSAVTPLRRSGNILLWLFPFLNVS